MAVKPYTTQTSYTTRDREVVGLEDAMRKLRALPEAVTGRNGGQVRSALMFATLPAYKAIKMKMAAHPAKPVRAAADKVRRQREKRPDKLNLSEAINLGIRDSFPPWWWWEWGTIDRYVPRTKHGKLDPPRHTGQLAESPFFRPGFDENRNQLGPRFAKKAAQLADKEARKLARTGRPTRRRA